MSEVSLDKSADHSVSATTSEVGSPGTGPTTPRTTTRCARSAGLGRADTATTARMFVNLVGLSLDGEWFLSYFFPSRNLLLFPDVFKDNLTHILNVSKTAISQ